MYEGGVVALRKESVDRNRAVWIEIVHSFSSLSARRAWIEIADYVEYNYNNKSLSARRAWIEIVNTADQEARKRSLSARRAWIEISLCFLWR